RPAERAMGGSYELETELRALAGARQHIGSLSELLRKAHVNDLPVQLEATAQTQAARLLADVDLMAQGLFLPSDPTFSWWDGAMPVAARSYGVANNAELAVVLEADRESLLRLTREYAEPLVKMLEALPGQETRTGRDLVVKWQAIMRVLARHEQKDRDTTLKRLEQFVLADMDKVDLNTCAGLSVPPDAAGGGDLFLRQLEVIRSGLGERCRWLARQRAVDAYARLHRLFNQTLAGRFPFAVDPAPATPRAEAGDVRQFFFALGRDGMPDRTALERAAGPEAATFVARLAEVRQALAPMLVDPVLEQPLAYEVKADFRTNADRDLGGNQVIEWVLDLGGDQRLSSLDAKRIATWTAGQPVRLSVRFARNAPTIPAADPRGRYRVDGPVATWEYKDPWALLSLLAEHAPAPNRVNELPDRKPHVLRLAVALGRNPDAASGAAMDAPTAELFLRLGLTSLTRIPGKPEQKDSVTLPTFPPSAPAVDPIVDAFPRARE
ncbi:MAG TPA: hypothetical protein VLL76_06460, partial [Candidatus Omnitrophota bacterium]|nr:hypothetical protein [Candidatus Omnitrophota bacterium]